MGWRDIALSISRRRAPEMAVSWSHVLRRRADTSAARVSNLGRCFAAAALLAELDKLREDIMRLRARAG